MHARIDSEYGCGAVEVDVYDSRASAGNPICIEVIDDTVDGGPQSAVLWLTPGEAKVLIAALQDAVGEVA